MSKGLEETALYIARMKPHSMTARDLCGNMRRHHRIVR